MLLNKKFFFFTFLLTLVVNNTHTHVSFKELGNAYTSSFGIIPESDKSSTKNDAKKEINFSISHMNNQEKRLALFNILSQLDANGIKPSPYHETVPQLLHDLAAIHGQQESESIHIASILNRCITTFGEAALVNLLGQNGVNHQSVYARQALIKELVENEELCASIEQSMLRLKEQESSLFSLYKEQEPELQKLIDNVFFTISPLKQYNKNVTALECSTRVGNALNALGCIKQLVVSTLVDYSLSNFINPQTLLGLSKEECLAYGIPANNESSLFRSCLKVINNIYNINEYKKVHSILSNVPGMDRWAGFFTALRVVNGITFNVAAGMDIYQNLKLARQHKNTINNLHTRLIGLASIVQESQTVCSLESEHPLIATGVANFKALEQLSANPEASEINELVKLLKTNTFKGEASFFSLSGRVLAAYTMAQEQKNSFAQAMLALGELDVCLALAKLIKEFKHQRVQYCFVNLVESKTPYLKLTNFWNPFVDPATVVTNSIELGGNQPRTMVVTGSNAGGKSTNLKAMMMCTLLGRTFGIAPAEEATMSYFALLASSMNVADNTANGTSLFQAEIKRAQKIVGMIDQLKNNGDQGFIIIDELFTGTATENGASAAKKIAAYIAKSPHALLILATHYKQLTTLEQEYPELFKNYKVDVYNDGNGNLVRPFKLEQGISTNNVANQMIEQHFDFITTLQA